MASIKDSKTIRFFYNLPGVSSAYHFLWAWTGAKFHGQPSKKIFIIGVTGTKGKTTTLELINAILEASGKRTALLSSLRVKSGEQSGKNQIGNTMPGRGYIQRFLKQAVRDGCGYALIEVASQGVVVHRHRFIDWNIGVLTNIAPEHIESHGSFENYRRAKLDFLKYVLKKGGKVFLNRDDKNFNFFIEALSAHETVSYSKDDESLKNYFPTAGPAQAMRDQSAPKFLLSDFNRENAAVAIAVGRELGITNRVIEEAILNFQGVPGRMEFVTAGPYTAIVDYAHTPDSLEAAYKAAKPKPNNQYPNPRLICVLGGAGGGRDKWKRPAMGTIARDYCDEIILTDEDPYDEDPKTIMSEIEGGIVQAEAEKKNVYKILDRKEAIKKAVGLMAKGDVVIGTGKGSEEWIHIARMRKIPWDEKQVFSEALAEKNKQS